MQTKAKKRAIKKKGHSHVSEKKSQSAKKKRVNVRGKKQITPDANSKKAFKITSKFAKPKPEKNLVSAKTKKSAKNKILAGKCGSKWVKGQSGNPKGRRKGSKNKFSVSDMQKALQKEALKNGYESPYEYVAERFFKDDRVLVNVLKKMLADLKSIEQITISGDSAESRRKSLAIQKIIQERCKTESNKETASSLEQ